VRPRGTRRTLRLPGTWRSRLLVGLVLLLLPSAALAYWSGVGTGTTSVTLPQPLPLSLSVGTPTDALSPGNSAGVALVVDNPNTIQEHITSFTLNSGGSTPISVDAAHAGCSVSVLSFTTATNGGVGWSVPPKVGASDGTLRVNLENSLAMSTAAANACQGAQFTIALVIG
jgi:hypothetical protein